MRKSLFENLQYYKPNFWHSVLILLIMLVVGLLLSLALMVGIALFTGKNVMECTANPSFSALNFALPFLPPFAWCMLYGAVKRRDGESPLPYNSPDWGSITPLKLFALLIPLTLCISLLLDPLSLLFEASEQMKRTFELQLSSFWGLLAIVVLAPLLEESLLRGTIARGLFANYQNPVVGIVASALLFGALHLNLWQAIPATLIGIALGWIYYRTHCLWCTIFMHFINNGCSALLYFLYPQKSLESALCQIMPLKLYIVCYVAAAIIAALIIYYLNKNLSKMNIRWIRRRDYTR